MSDAVPLLDHVAQPLWPYLHDPETEDVAVQAPGEVWICTKGKWRCEEAAITEDDVYELAWLAGALSKTEVDEAAPLCDEHLPGGERLAICMPPAAVRVDRDEDGKVCINGFPSLTFRKHEDTIASTDSIVDRYRTAGWNKWERQEGGRNWTKLLAIYDGGDFGKFLAAAVQERLNILQVGATGSGKTTLNKTACTAIDDAERVLTVEDTIELFLRQQNVVRLLARGITSFADALKMTLRMRGGRVLLQELRDGASTWTLFNDVVGPHPGVITTIHGHDAVSGIARLATLLRSAKEAHGMTRDDIGWLFNQSIDLVIPLHLGDDGVRDIFPVWFAGDAYRRGETAADLLR